ncbi:MAG: rod shape-determining protein MreC [Chloroflexota bacterium]
MRPPAGRVILLAALFSLAVGLTQPFWGSQANGVAWGRLWDIVLPGTSAITDFVEPAAGILTGLGRIQELEEEARQLRAEVDRLRGELTRLREVEEENQRLRELLGAKRRNPNFQFALADVIGREPAPFVEAVIVNKGSQDGIEPGMVVVGAAGLLGKVVKVSAGTARVLLLTDPSSAVAARIQRSDAREITGLVVGQGQGRLLMRYIAQGEPLQVGDQVVTSGLGETFPKGLAIGRVVQVRRLDVEPFQEAVIEPAVALGRLENVLIITNFRPPRLD